MWPDEKANPIGTCVQNNSTLTPAQLYIEFDVYSLPVVFPTEPMKGIFLPAKNIKLIIDVDSEFLNKAHRGTTVSVTSATSLKSAKLMGVEDSKSRVDTLILTGNTLLQNIEIYNGEL